MGDADVQDKGTGGEIWEGSIGGVGLTVTDCALDGASGSSYLYQGW